MTKSTKNKKETQFRKIHSLMDENPRITFKSISKRLKVYEKTASKLVNTMFAQGIITTPQARIKSFWNMKEYVYFMDVENKLKAYHAFIKEGAVVYVGVLIGSPNFWVVSEKPLSLEYVVYAGVRSDYYVGYPSWMSWKESVAAMKQLMDFL